MGKIFKGCWGTFFTHRMRKLKYIIAVVILSLSGCVTTGCFESFFNDLLGYPIQHYEQIAGNPTRIDATPDGNKVYVYQLKGYRYCTVFFEVDSNGIITKWWHEGSACKAPCF